MRGAVPRGWSLSARLLALATVWIATALMVAWIVLTDLFRAHAEAELARRMEHHLDELTAALEVQPGGMLAVTRDLSEPRFHRPLSGLYWQVTGNGAGIEGETLRSRSLWDQVLDLPEELPGGGEVRRHVLAGPGSVPLIAWQRVVRLPGYPVPVRTAVAADASDIAAAAVAFTRVLSLSLVVLAAGLLAAAVAQVRLGLVPLGKMRAALADLRAGRAQRLEGDFPAEVRPLAEDLNQLLAENAAMLARARAQAGDLAHALKTPLAVIANAAAGETDTARLIAGEAERMRRQVDRHLARARAASAARQAGPGVSVKASLAGLVRAVARLYADRDIRFALTGDDTAAFRGDIQDFQEMMGNLIDNAAKWARTQVRVTVATAGGHVCILVEDDGPGIPPDRLAVLPERGTRFDETTPGHGLGLAITDELALLYGGTLRLAVAENLGGLQASLSLPEVRHQA